MKSLASCGHRAKKIVNVLTALFKAEAYSPKLVPIDFVHSKTVLLSPLINKNRPTQSLSDLLIGKG